MHGLDAPDCGEASVAYGFKIPEFPQGRGCKSMLEAVEAREHHLKAHWLFKAMEMRREIPGTFDDRTPEEAFGTGQQPRLRIGDTHFVPNEIGRQVPGVLYESTVLEPERKAYCAYQSMDGRSIIVSVPLTDVELAIYQRLPETFSVL